MDTKKLEQWANLLLDTGKRNNLINFKDSKAATAEIVVPDSEALFGKALGGASFEVYDPKIVYEEPEIEEISPEEDTALSGDVVDTNTGEVLALPLDSDKGNAESTAASSSERDNYIKTYAPKMRKASHILLYNAAGNPLDAVKNIQKKAKSVIEETGVNVAYLAFGFVHWGEEAGSNIYRAPILLMPVYFTSESTLGPYHLKTVADEAIVNPTFNFKLTGEKEIALPAYEDEGLGEYISKVEKLMARFGWTVTSECKLGIFSFLKLNMYQDLMKNRETILKNHNVRVLLGEPTEDAENVSEIAEFPQELHNVVDADSSQNEAIRMAKAGKSFVLQGPPGTGKSQTITNIIAECLYDGKKVLFVSEKQAALNVVYDKLKKVGLEDFCLELHSYKANKKDVIDNLCHTLRTGKTGVSAKADGEIEQKKRAQTELDDYEHELHAVREPIGRSLYQLYDAFADVKDAQDIEYTFPEIGEKGEDYRALAVSLLEQYADFVPQMGYDYRENAWYGFAVPDTSYEGLRAERELLAHMENVTAEMLPVAEKIEADYGVSCKNLEELQMWRDFFAAAAHSRFLTPAFLTKESFESVTGRLDELEAQSGHVVEMRSKLLEEYDEDLFKIDGNDYHKKLERQFGGTISRLLNGEYRGMIGALRLANKKGRKPSYEEALSVTENLGACRDMMAKFAAAEEASGIKEVLGAGYKGYDTDWDALMSDAGTLERLFAKQGSLGRISELDPGAYEHEKMQFSECALQIDSLFSKCGKDSEKLNDCFESKIIDTNKIELDQLHAKFARCLAEFDSAEGWCRLWELILNLKRNGLGTYLDYVIDQKIPEKSFVKVFEKRFYFQWIDRVIHDVTALETFSRVTHDKAVETFCEKDETQFAISKVQIKAALSSKRPSLDVISAGGAVANLLREGEKKRKQKSIRALLEENGELVQLLKPCFLMSPLSVSTYLSNDAIHFDLVVFDEASQIFPQDAIGSICRAKQLIVVGDSKQMPPSDFFNANVLTDTFDEEVGDVTDFESILDICTATFPQRRLKWHYRSRHEQLIAFSNRSFYDGELVTFPAPTTDKEGVGVDYFFAGGEFEHKKRTNRKEAEFVVDLIYRNIEKYPKRSLGVVAFSIAQQDLIERLLNKRRQDDPSKEFFFSGDSPEPFFIKNLETVQGDERDTIIFSVAYAKDSTGRLMHNFGPLNRVGGERRLNVAVTRAKVNVQLVASIHHTDIDPAKTEAVGARLLRAYLDYAENGHLEATANTDADPFHKKESAFADEVCEFLRENGFAVDQHIGYSSMRIDMAVKKPETTDYVLAIECDGETYHASKSARDRDRLRRQVLERMGWKFCRVWSTEWYKNGDTEKARLQGIAARAFDPEKEEEPELPEDVPEEFEEEIATEHFEFPKYQMADVHEIRNRNEHLLPMVKEILAIEAPLSEEWLLKRICFFFNRTKVTASVQEDYTKKMYDCARVGIVREDGFLYLTEQSEYVLRVPEGEVKREMKYISKEELAVGMREVIRLNVSVDEESLFKTIAKLLGYGRLTEPMREQMEVAYAYLKEKEAEDTAAENAEEQS